MNFYLERCSAAAEQLEGLQLSGEADKPAAGDVQRPETEKKNIVTLIAGGGGGDEGEVILFKGHPELNDSPGAGQGSGSPSSGRLIML